jgi:hypothetical protein
MCHCHREDGQQDLTVETVCEIYFAVGAIGEETCTVQAGSSEETSWEGR